jgi:hypothetical protein
VGPKDVLDTVKCYLIFVLFLKLITQKYNMLYVTDAGEKIGAYYLKCLINAQKVKQNINDYEYLFDCPCFRGRGHPVSCSLPPLTPNYMDYFSTMDWC